MEDSRFGLVNANVQFCVGDEVQVDKDGTTIEGEVVAVNGQQITIKHEHGICYGWRWTTRKLKEE